MSATHEYGTQRIRTRFAWLPVRMTDGRKVWLERYELTEIYCLVYGFSPYYGDREPAWVPVMKRALGGGR